jgi:hypothetical protein
VNGYDRGWWKSNKYQSRGDNIMSIMEECNKNLNLHIKEETYEEICRAAFKEGRKPGNLARMILEVWAKNQKKNVQAK